LLLGKVKRVPERNRYVALAIIHRTDRLAAILEDQTSKDLVLRWTEEVTEAFRDAIPLQVAKFLVESELFLEGAEGAGRVPQLCHYVERTPVRGECPTYDRLALKPGRISEEERWASGLVCFECSESAMLVAKWKLWRLRHGQEKSCHG
jgi:hypothetical protein